MQPCSNIIHIKRFLTKYYAKRNIHMELYIFIICFSYYTKWYWEI